MSLSPGFLNAAHDLVDGWRTCFSYCITITAVAQSDVSLQRELHTVSLALWLLILVLS